MPNKLPPDSLLYTERGQKWLSQFKEEDKENAERLVSNLTLISSSEFARSVQKFLELEATKEEYIAFYAVRELDAKLNQNFFEQALNPNGTLNALSSGNDHGSEVIIANLIRNFCKQSPDLLLNHPNIETLKQTKCRNIILIDDFIGSGKRVRDFLQGFWDHPTIKSWHSRKYINFSVIAYSGTDRGIKLVQKHKLSPNVTIERPCPSLLDLPWRPKYKIDMLSFIEKYGRKTVESSFWGGFKLSMTTLVFEHSCPNNTPSILWSRDDPTFPWHALFPNKSVLSAEKDAFPLEVIAKNSKLTLLESGQKRLSNSENLDTKGKVSEMIILVLALIAQGHRKLSTISHATGFNLRTCSIIIEKCKEWGFITTNKRITKRGNDELRGARTWGSKSKINLPDRGEDYYHPKQLRGITHG